jgi:hypothetical protein
MHKLLYGPLFIYANQYTIRWCTLFKVNQDISNLLAYILIKKILLAHENGMKQWHKC